MKTYFDLTKFGIVIFVTLTALAGYLISYSIETPFDWQVLAKLLVGIYFLSSGSLALNQLQELKRDRLMPRTSKRPIASGKVKPLAAGILAVCFLFTGSALLFDVGELSGYLGLLTLVLYNIAYTYWWKPKMTFGAVPGAVPGSLPVTIGFAANTDDIFSTDSVYLFLILFLWQMPHFWALAIRFRKDYEAGGVPTLPVTLGVERTLYHIGIYTIAYVGMALMMPFFFKASWSYLFFVLPNSYFVIAEFLRFFRSNGEQRWFPFFMWTNVSVLFFLFVPVVDKWGFVLFPSN